VLNRPESFRQLFASEELLSAITSDYVLILETDHVLMQPIPNLASETKPAAYDFGYMHVRQSHILWTLYILYGCVYILVTDHVCS